MSKPACLVDGHLERMFVQRACPKMVVRLLQCNGDHVALQAIADRVITHCRLLHGKCYPIMVIIDREDREQSAVEISKKLLSLVKEGGIIDELVVAVADRNIENWIISDNQTIEEMYPGTKLTWENTPDGFNGKSKLKDSLGTYHETTTGVQLLLKCRPSVMRRSPSFDFFFQQVATYDCWWLEK